MSKRASGTRNSSKHNIARKRLVDRLAGITLAATATIACLWLFIVAYTLVANSLDFLRVAGLEFILGTRWEVLFGRPEYGILPLLAGTLIVAVIAIAVAGSLGLGIAVYLSEYASPRARRLAKPVLELLAGIPTVVYGYFALYYITPVLDRLVDVDTHNALSAGIAVGIMITPIVASISEDSLYRVPDSLRLAAYALGASKAQVITRVVLRAALPGIIAAYIIAFARAIGETMIVTIAAGFRPVLSLNPLESVQTMTAYIAQVATGDAPHGTLVYQSLFAVGLALLAVVLAFNTLGLIVTRRYAISLRAV